MCVCVCVCVCVYVCVCVCVCARARARVSALLHALLLASSVFVSCIPFFSVLLPVLLSNRGCTTFAGAKRSIAVRNFDQSIKTTNQSIGQPMNQSIK